MTDLEMALDPEHLADQLAGRDSHLELDIPLAVAEAMRAIAADRDNLRVQLDAANRRAATAELALLNMTARVDRQSTTDVLTFDGDVDDAAYFCAVGL